MLARIQSLEKKGNQPYIKHAANHSISLVELRTMQAIHSCLG